MINRLNLKAYAKINLGLDVLGTLPNGYHEVRMIMQSIGIYDKVNLFRNRSGKITVKTNLGFLPTGPDNLVYKAAALLKEEFGIRDGISIDLYKYIPVAAGMAGGSSDAAAVLRGMNTMFGLGLSEQDLKDRGARLGADIPYCIMGGTALAEGIGEKLTRLCDCPPCHVVIAKPGISVSTRYVYEKLVLNEETKHPDIDGILQAIEGQELTGICDRLYNVLENVTKTEYPVIGEIESAMKEEGALAAIMSGSGPTVFGIFADREHAEQCNNRMRNMEQVRNSYVTEPVGCEVNQC